jgi:hypothetical protein
MKWFIFPVKFLRFAIWLAKIMIWQGDDVRRLVKKQKNSKHTEE